MNRQTYFKILAIVILVKALIATFFPILSDEAHHLLWGIFPSWGHADHPAMMGWFGAAFSWLGHSALAYRTSSILVTLVIAEVMRALMKKYDEPKANLIAALYILTPQSLLSLVVTPEIPLMFFSFFTVIAIFKSHKENSAMWAIVAGLLQSAALTSKYNALWLGACAFYFFVINPKTRNLKLCLAYGLGCAPAFAIFYFYNVNHCWINLNRLLARMNGSDFKWYGPAIAVALQFWVATPWGLWTFFKRRTQVMSDDITQPLPASQLRNLLPIFFWIPFLMFCYVSFGNKIGVHWLGSFYPFFFMTFMDAPTAHLKKQLKWIAGFSFLHVAVIACIPFISIQKIGSSIPRYHHDLVIAFYPQEICTKMMAIAGNDATLATFDYSQSSTLWINCQKKFPRFGFGKLDGREFDKIIDYRSLDNRPIAILRRNKIKSKHLKQTIKNPMLSDFIVEGKKFYMVHGTFDYNAFKDKFLKRQLNKIYDKKSRTLPNDKCYFKKRYFPELYKSSEINP